MSFLEAHGVLGALNPGIFEIIDLMRSIEIEFQQISVKFDLMGIIFDRSKVIRYFLTP